MAGLVLGAGVLRFAGLGHDLWFGYGPTTDERDNFIQPVLQMWARGSPNPRVYSGYPGFFNYLIFLPVGLGSRLGGEPAAYLAGRAVVAAFGTLNVLLLYRLLRPLAGIGPALFGAALLSVSRGEIREAHFLSPDVLIVTAILGILHLLAHRPAAVVQAGVVGGLAAATKYTGLLAAPALLIGLAADGRLRRQSWRAAVAALVAFAVAAPFAVLRRSPQGAGLVSSLEHYYSQAGADSVGVLERLARPVGYVTTNVGALALLLAVGAVVLYRRWRLSLPSLAVLGCSLMVMAPADVVYPRHAIIPSAAATVLAGIGLAGLLERLPAGRWRVVAGTALAITATGMAASASRLVALRFLVPSPAERAAAWIEERQPGPLLVVTTLDRFALPADRYRVRTGWTSKEDLPPRSRVVVTDGPEPAGLAGFREAAVFPSLETRSVRVWVGAAP